jgi:predicted secreted protein
MIMTRTGPVLLAVLLAAGGCAPRQEELMGARGARADREAEQRAARAAGPVQEVGPDQNGSIVVLPPGGSLVVRLPGNITTGYAWEVGAAPAFLGTPARDYVQDPSEPGMTGVGGTARFTFRATGRGRGLLRLDHRGAGGRGVAETWQIEVLAR